jgi:hypothetical protein
MRNAGRIYLSEWRRGTSNLICKSTGRGWSPFLDFAWIFLQRKWKSDHCVVMSDPNIPVYLLLVKYSGVISSRTEHKACRWIDGFLYFSVPRENMQHRTCDFGCSLQSEAGLIRMMYYSLFISRVSCLTVPIFGLIKVTFCHWTEIFAALLKIQLLVLPDTFQSISLLDTF